MKYIIRSLFIGSLIYFSANYSMDDWYEYSNLIESIHRPIEFLENRITKFLDVKGSADGGYAKQLLLEASAHKDGTSLAQRLLDYQVDPNKMLTNFTYAPLHMACEFDNASTVRLLLSKKADVNLKSALGEASSLGFAASNGLPDIADILLSQMPDLDMQDFYGNTPLHSVVFTFLLDKSPRKRNDFIKKLIQAGASPYIRKKNLNHKTREYEIGENVYEFIEKKRGAEAFAEIKKYRSTLRLRICWILTKKLLPILPKDIVQLIVNFVYPNNPEKKS